MKMRNNSDKLNLDKISVIAFNELKTNIQFMSQGSESKVIMVASANRNEGRTTTAAYLSIVLAKSGEKTLLIDCDQKNSTIHNIFNIQNDKGLVDILSEEIKYEEGVKPTNEEHLFVLTAGSKSSNYAKLLSSPKFNGFIQSLKERFDYIIIDTPPVNEGADAQAISKCTDGCVLVVESGQTERKSVQKAKEILQNANANIIGVFLNKTK